MENQQLGNKSCEISFQWFIIAQFFYAQFVDGFRAAMLVPIWKILALYYQVYEKDINWLTNWIYILPFFLGFFLNIITKKNYGISQTLCGFFEVLGIWLAYCAKSNYYLAVAGYAIMGIGSSFLTQTPLYLSKLWFDSQERIVSTFLGQYSNHIGALAGFIFTSFYFYGIDDWNQIVIQIDQVFFITAILVTTSFAFSFIALTKPRKENYEILAREDQLKSIKKIFSQSEFCLDIISFSILIKFPYMYPSLLMYQQILLNKQFTEIFLNSFIFQSSGISLAIFFTFKLYKQSKKGLQQNYDYYLKRFFTIGYVALIIEILFLENLSNYSMIILNVFIGGGISSLQSVMLESLMEKHFPVSELALGQLLVGSSGLIAFILAQILTSDMFYQFGLQLLCYVLIFPFCFILTFYKTQFIRFEAEA